MMLVPGLTCRMKPVSHEVHADHLIFTCLCRSYGQDVWAGSWETWIEDSRCTVVVGTIRVEALATITSDTIISGRVQESGSQKAELHISGGFVSA